ncbi:Chitinase class I [compost metagenome]
MLLNDPDRIAVEGRLGFTTAILFWLTPQDPKPSAHDIMAGNYVPTSEQLAKGLVPGIGATIMVINGAWEGNFDETGNRICREETLKD